MQCNTIIATQLQSTPLGHWVHTGYQKWTHFLTTTGTLMKVDPTTTPPQGTTPVDVNEDLKLKIYGIKPTPLPTCPCKQDKHTYGATWKSTRLDEKDVANDKMDPRHIEQNHHRS